MPAGTACGSASAICPKAELVRSLADWIVSVLSTGVTSTSELAGGGTQCVQTSNTGLISGTGSACGAGGGGVTVAAGAGILVNTVSTVSTVSTDPSVIPTKSVVQNTTSNIATVTSSSASALTATMSPTLGVYSDKQIVELTWNQNCASGAKTLAINGLAAMPLKLYDGSTNLATADCANGYTNIFSYDGSLSTFKLMGGGSTGGGSSLSLTTTGSSGAATLVGTTLNIPVYSGGGGTGTVTTQEQTFVIPASPVVYGNVTYGAGWTAGGGCISTQPCYVAVASGAAGFLTAYWTTPSAWTSGTIKLIITFQGSGSGNTLQFNVSSCYLTPAASFTLTCNTPQLFPSQATSGGTIYTLTSPSLTQTGITANAPLVFNVGYPTSGGGNAYVVSMKAVVTIP